MRIGAHRCGVFNVICIIKHTHKTTTKKWREENATKAITTEHNKRMKWRMGFKIHFERLRDFFEKEIEKCQSIWQSRHLIHINTSKPSHHNWRRWMRRVVFFGSLVASDINTHTWGLIHVVSTVFVIIYLGFRFFFFFDVGSAKSF